MKKKKSIKTMTAVMALSLAVTFQLVSASAMAQSLWSENGYYHSIFADRKACQVGDILTIVISESTTTSA